MLLLNNKGDHLKQFLKQIFEQNNICFTPSVFLNEKVWTFQDQTWKYSSIIDVHQKVWKLLFFSCANVWYFLQAKFIHLIKLIHYYNERKQSL